MNIYFVPFKVIPLGYNTFMPAFFPILEALKKIIFCDLVQLLLRCRLYLLNRGVASSFHGPLQFWKKEKVTGGQVWGIRLAAAPLLCCFWPNIRAQATMCEQGRYHGAKAGRLATRLMLKSLVKIEWHEPIDMFRFSATSLTVIRRLANTIFFTLSMFSSVVDVLGRPERSSSFTSSRPSENILYHR